jgi:WD40 repeat protein
LGGIWSLADAKGLGKLSLDGHKDAVESVTISADNRYLVTTSQDNTTIVWPMLSLEATDLGEVKPVATLIGHRDDVAGAAISSSSAPSADPLVVITVISYLSYLLLYLDKIRLLGFTTLHDSRRYAIPPYLIPNLSLLSDKIR